jgi:hypothetical protein
MALTVAGVVAPHAADATGLHVVTNTADSGTGSLREALQAAGDGDLVTFASSVTGAIDLTSPLHVDHAVTIHGPGADKLSIDGQNQVVDLVVDDPNAGVVTISGLTFTHGKGVTGGAVDIASRSNVAMSRVRVTDSSASTGGGGIYVEQGSLSLRTSTVSGNTAPKGGGIFANLVDGNGVTIKRSTVSGNTATAGQGGGVYIRGASESLAPVDNASTACPAGTSLYLVEGYIPRCGYTPSGPPGYEYCPDVGTYYGVYDSCLIDPVTTETRTPGRYTSGGVSRITLSTIAGNTSPAGDAAVYLTRLGSESLIGSSTIASNVGGGIAADQPSVALSLASDIVAANTKDCLTGDLTDRGYNLDGDGSCGLTAPGSKPSAPGLAAALGALRDNGGPTATMALALTSDPAAGAVPTGFALPGVGAPVCGVPDQRGVLAASGGCAAGAFQIEDAPSIRAILTHLRRSSSHGSPGRRIRVTFSCKSAAPKIDVTCPPPVTVHGAGDHTVTGTVIAEDGRTATVTKHVHVAVAGVDNAGNRVVRRGSYRAG